METIRLWTIQTSLAWSVLSERGQLRGDGRYSDRYFRKAYRWLREEMKTRTAGSSGRYPLWFWTIKPDLRRVRYRNYCKEPTVLLECLVPNTRVLLSDYESWHTILNNGYLSLTEVEWDEWYRRVDSGELSVLEEKVEREESWKRVFDFEALSFAPEWGQVSVDDVQATLETLYLSEVVSVRHYEPRP